MKTLIMMNLETQTCEMWTKKDSWLRPSGENRPIREENTDLWV